MSGAEAKLAKWTALYGRFEDVRERLKAPVEPGRRGRERSALNAEMIFLRHACSVALQELHAESTRMKIGNS
jgi:hypothetical protein